MTDMVLKTFWHHSPASFSFSGCGTNLAPIGCAFRLFQNDLNRYKFVSEQVNTTDSGILVFIDRFPSFSTLSWDYTAFELRKLLSNWSSSHCVLSKSYFQCLAKLLLPFSPSLQQKFFCCIGNVKKRFTSRATKVAVKFRSLSFCLSCEHVRNLSCTYLSITSNMNNVIHTSLWDANFDIPEIHLCFVISSSVHWVWNSSVAITCHRTPSYKLEFYILYIWLFTKNQYKPDFSSFTIFLHLWANGTQCSYQHSYHHIELA